MSVPSAVKRERALKKEAIKARLSVATVNTSNVVTPAHKKTCARKAGSRSTLTGMLRSKHQTVVSTLTGLVTVVNPAGGRIYKIGRFLVNSDWLIVGDYYGEMDR